MKTKLTKRKDLEYDKCGLCGCDTTRKFQLGKNPKTKHFVCKKCRPYITGGKNE